MKLIFSLVVLIYAGLSFSCSEDGRSGFLPENDKYIPVGQKFLAGGITETEFNAVITKVETIYAPVVSNLGKTLVINRKWTDGTVNANASQSGSIWTVNMFGGLARSAPVTADGFSIVLCHEMGHHLGGATKKTGFNKWASSEGQSDYFTATKCLRKIWVNDDNQKIVSKMVVPELLRKSCENVHGSKTSDFFICVRTGIAGVSVGKLLADTNPEPKFDTPDPKVVTSTYHEHPKTQCRFDTFFQGALCEVGMNEQVSNTDETTGYCHGKLGHTVGLRPLCWFKPSVE